MLDSETKRRIDTARDILVGKVPDPKGQVQQITIALIYKFMDDMDADSEEMGGTRKFFAGEFARYGWAKLMRSGLGGHETLNLYAESIAKMPENQGIPPLFREIFKDAFLPYRDPETLRSFLKVIDEFEYDHSESLGDAFEYLLSVLGSQGEAGQFRTPRHIIDFIVEIIDPKKTETILDPACGTAGFLISSYKHILKANKDEEGNSTLTPDDRARLATNFKGYDISPDMVRLSLVNMYLHGFTDPHIHEYDTLTSQDRWNEYADVILANPPFMSPTGGIRPHNRFSVQSKRSEVLFVDYMAEHLAPAGRAGIIVPEGIIFQAQSAYTQLRRMLVEEYLVAVVSLPQGVFNPYSGVKTSVLLLDKARASRSDHVLFVRIDDDGHDLGPTRKVTGGGDLRSACEVIQRWQQGIDTGTAVSAEVLQASRASAVARDEIAGSGDYKLTAESYRVIGARREGGGPWAPLRQVLGARKSDRVGADQSLPVLSITMKHGLVDQADKFKKRIASTDISGYKRVGRNDLVVGFPVDEGVLGIQSKYPYAAVSPAYDVWEVRVDLVDVRYLELVLRSPQARRRYHAKMRGTAGRRRTLDKGEFLSIEIPVPSLEVQRAIADRLAGYRAAVAAAEEALSGALKVTLAEVWAEPADLGDTDEGSPEE
ncbi:MAG: N-6 DNA methylase [Planctomycetes bacterium]|nr:N-6 DNA methylase [Planctomycetota bacterium]